MVDSSVLRRGARTLRNALRTLDALIGGSDTRLLVVGISVSYFVLYSAVVGHLVPGNGTFEVFVVADPVERMSQPTGTLAYEPIARIDLLAVGYLFSPFNFGLAVVVSVLVALNLSVSFLLWRYPSACDVGSTSSSVGVLASLPALLSGAACCGPVVLIVLGVQASGFLLAAFSSLVPVAIGLLLVTLVYTTTNVDPEAIR